MRIFSQEASSIGRGLKFYAVMAIIVILVLFIFTSLAWIAKIGFEVYKDRSFPPAWQAQCTANPVGSTTLISGLCKFNSVLHSIVPSELTKNDTAEVLKPSGSFKGQIDKFNDLVLELERSVSVARAEKDSKNVAEIIMAIIGMIIAIVTLILTFGAREIARLEKEFGDLLAQAKNDATVTQELQRKLVKAEIEIRNVFRDEAGDNFVVEVNSIVPELRMLSLGDEESLRTARKSLVNYFSPARKNQFPAVNEYVRACRDALTDKDLRKWLNFFEPEKTRKN